jgi:hypothetical protein
MITHNISLRYMGRMASIGAMDAGYVDKAMAGVRLVLASHCHFLTTGRVPDRVRAKTQDFQIVAGAPREGSLELQFVVLLSVVAGGVGTAIAWTLKGIFEEAGKDIYKDVLQHHIRAWLKRYAYREALNYDDAKVSSTLSRDIEPSLPWPTLTPYAAAPSRSAGSSGEMPSSHSQSNRAEAEYQRLLDRTDTGLTAAATPVGREGGSSAVECRIDGEFIGRLGEPHAQTHTRGHDHDIDRIAQALERMRRHRD